MCGIAGTLDRRGLQADPELLRRMTSVLAHRGPDGDGIVCRGPVGLGHRRLSIIDLATGAQPMGNEDGTLWITYNGELYNFRELRAQLVSRGARFRTTSDTEVILKAYEADGVAALPQLRGMFAFAIWDERARRLLLARDRVGIKPLVYAWDGERLVFGSELKALLQDPGVGRELDGAAMADYLAYLHVPAPRTIFRDIRKLPPASYLSLSLDGGEPEIATYWRLTFAPDHTVAVDEWVERLQASLEESVRVHLVSDVPVGAFLSGGIDSSTVVAHMARVSSSPVRTFSIGFDDADFDELAYARQVAKRYGTDHYEFVVKPDALAVLPRLAWQFDEPFGDASAVPTYCVSKITREHVTVALSGDGGDEAFAGYQRYARALALHHRMDRGAGRVVRPLLAATARRLPRGMRGRGVLEMLGTNAIERYATMMRCPWGRPLADLLTGDAARWVAADPGSERLAELARAADADYLSTLQYVDVHSYLPEDILTKVDRASMLVSLETRVPLLDHVVLELAATIPSELKVCGGEGKWVLKRAMADLLPSTVLGRRKMGFGVPLARWFRHDLHDHVHDTLLGRRARHRGLFRPETVAALLREHEHGGRDRSGPLWALLCFEEWCRMWLDGGAA